MKKKIIYGKISTNSTFCEKVSIVDLMTNDCCISPWERIPFFFEIWMIVSVSGWFLAIEYPGGVGCCYF